MRIVVAFLEEVITWISASATTFPATIAMTSDEEYGNDILATFPIDTSRSHSSSAYI